MPTHFCAFLKSKQTSSYNTTTLVNPFLEYIFNFVPPPRSTSSIAPLKNGLFFVFFFVCEKKNGCYFCSQFEPEFLSAVAMNARSVGVGVDLDGRSGHLKTL